MSSLYHKTAGEVFYDRHSRLPTFNDELYILISDGRSWRVPVHLLNRPLAELIQLALKRACPECKIGVKSVSRLPKSASAYKPNLTQAFVETCNNCDFIG